MLRWRVRESVLSEDFGTENRRGTRRSLLVTGGPGRGLGMRRKGSEGGSPALGEWSLQMGDGAPGRWEGRGQRPSHSFPGRVRLLSLRKAIGNFSSVKEGNLPVLLVIRMK